MYLAKNWSIFKKSDFGTRNHLHILSKKLPLCFEPKPPNLKVEEKIENNDVPTFGHFEWGSQYAESILNEILITLNKIV